MEAPVGPPGHAFVALATKAITKAPDETGAIAAYLASVCTHLEWQAGIFYIVDPGAPRLVTPTCEVHQVGTPALDGVPALAVRPPAPDFQGLSGRVLDSGKPAWVADLENDPNFRARAYAQAMGLRSALAVPVYVQDRLGALAEFFAGSQEQPSPPTLDTITIVTGVLGKRLSLAIKPSERSGSEPATAGES